MAQNPPEFLSNDFSHLHHRKAVAALIVAGIVFGVVVLGYLLAQRYSKQSTPSTFDPLAVRQALLAQSNPPVNLTPEEISARQKLLTAPNPPIKLTPEQVKARQDLLNNQ